MLSGAQFKKKDGKSPIRKVYFRQESIRKVYFGKSIVNLYKGVT